MRLTTIWFGLAGLAMGWLAGCSAAPSATEPTLARVTAEDPAAYDRLWNTVGDTLREQYFRLDRQDRLEGIITTHPETSAQFFELWRPQPETAATWAEANLQTIQRAAKITIKPAGEAGAYELVVQVDDARYSLPERQIDNSAGALRLYSADAPTETGEMQRPSKTAQTIALGRDKAAEERLLKLILDRYAKGPASTTEPAE